MLIEKKEFRILQDKGDLFSQKEKDLMKIYNKKLNNRDKK